MIIHNIKQPAKLNKKQLIQEIVSVQSGVVVKVTEHVKWEKFPYSAETKPHHVELPNDLNVAWTSPFVVEIVNGEESNRAKFEQVITNHDPEFTDAEERQQLVTQKRAQELLEALLTLPDEYLSQIKAKFDALP